jgi:hypothetical protein
VAGGGRGALVPVAFGAALVTATLGAAAAVSWAGGARPPPRAALATRNPSGLPLRLDTGPGHTPSSTGLGVDGASGRDPLP